MCLHHFICVGRLHNSEPEQIAALHGSDGRHCETAAFTTQGQEPAGLLEEEAARLLVASSGKMAMLAAMLPALLAGGHRILIFSQLKGVLTLLEDMLHDFPAREALPERFRRRGGGGARWGCISLFSSQWLCT